MVQKGMIAAATIMMASMLAWAQSPAPAPITQPTADRVAAFIAQLGSPKYAERQQAQKGLIEIGAPAEAALRDAAAHSSSGEIRARAASAANKIEDNLPDAPTRVSVEASGENPGKVCRAMAEQAGIAIDPDDDEMWSGESGAKPITLHLGRVPLLVALEKFCQATGTHLIANGGDRGVLEIASGPSGVWDQQDRMAMIAERINHDRTIELGGNDVNRLDTLSVSIFFDPRLGVITWQMPHLLVAQDENGASLLVDNSQNPGFNPNSFDSHWGYAAQIPLKFPPHVGKKLSRLEGTIAMRVVTKSEMLKIPDLTKAVGPNGAVTAGHRKVEVLGFDFNNGIANLHVRVTNTRPPGMLARAFGADPGNLFQEFQTAELVDANGTVTICGGGSGGGSNTYMEWQSQITSGNGKALKGPFALRWKVVTESKEISVPFAFKNLSLPPE